MQQSKRIVEAKKQGETGVYILELKDEFEIIEKSVLKKLKSAHEKEDEHTSESKSKTHNSIKIMNMALLFLPIVLIVTIIIIAVLTLKKVIRPISHLVFHYEAVLQKNSIS